MPRLENWLPDAMVKEVVTGRFAVRSLVGQVYDDEKNRFEDGEVVTTSLIFSINSDQTEAHTLNTVYKLGKPAKEWEDFCREHDVSLGGYSLEAFMNSAAASSNDDAPSSNDDASSSNDNAQSSNDDVPPTLH